MTELSEDKATVGSISVSALYPLVVSYYRQGRFNSSHKVSFEIYRAILEINLTALHREGPHQFDARVRPKNTAVGVL